MWSNPYNIPNLPVSTKKGASDYLFMGKLIFPFAKDHEIFYISQVPYIDSNSNDPKLNKDSTFTKLGAYPFIKDHVG